MDSESDFIASRAVAFQLNLAKKKRKNLRDASRARYYKSSKLGGNFIRVKAEQTDVKQMM